uniref:E3 ubiquitin-protein ligase ZFP91-like n=1 Tax=Callithrix jacchus TaxID=9483 RepID=UPI0008402433|nr:E3 ubiquitin-protein ligase ZFP91-like [Callithrix jacchus]
MWSYKEKEEYLKSQNLRRGFHEMDLGQDGTVEAGHLFLVVVIQQTPEALRARPVHCNSSASQNRIQTSSVMTLEKSISLQVALHDVESSYQFSCNICGKRFEKDIVVAHKAKSHPEVLIEEALAANTSTLIISTDILGTNPESLTQPSDGQGFPFLPEPLGNSTSEGCLPLEAERMSGSYCSGMGQVSLMADGKSFVGSSPSEGTEGLLMNSDAITEALIEDSDYRNLVKDKVYRTLVEGKTWSTGTVQTLYLKVKRTKKQFFFF